MAKAVAKTKAKKKKWYPLLAPKLLNEKQLGEAYVTDPDVLVGRSVSMNMSEITGNRRLQKIILNCEVKQMVDGKGRTFVRGFEMSAGSVKRFVRKGRARIDDSFVLKTADGLRVRVKPMAVTQGRTSKSVLTNIRTTAKQMLGREFKKKSYNELLNNIFSFSLQKDMKSKLSKIYPIRNFEIRVMKLLDNKAPAETVDSKDSEEKASETKKDSEGKKTKKSETKAKKSEEKASETKKDSDSKKDSKTKKDSKSKAKKSESKAKAKKAESKDSKAASEEE